MTNDLFLQIRYTSKFKKELKRLSKKYNSIQGDIQGFIDTIQPDNFPGDIVQGIKSEGTIYKERIKNSDNNKGKSSGYRVIYGYFSPETIVLIYIYSKSEQPNITPTQINDILSNYELEIEEE